MRKINFFYHINLDNQSAGGILNFLRGLITNLEISVPIHYYSLQYKSDLEIDRENFSEIFLKPMSNNPNEKIKLSNNFIYMLELLKLFKYKNFSNDDILIFNRSDHALISLIRRVRGKKVLIIHGTTKYDKFYYKHSIIKRLFSKFSEHFAIKYFDKIIAVSEDALEYYLNLYPKLAYKFQYITTFVDKNIFNKKKIIQHKSKLSFIYYGRFVEEKGLYYLKSFFDYLNEQSIDYEATLIGEGELESIFYPNKKVEIINALPQEEIVDYLHKKTILLMFSEGEGTPLTLLEALSTGTPAICSNVGGMSKVIQNAKNGFLFDNIPNQFSEITKKALEIFENYSYYSNEAVISSKIYSLDEVAIKYKNLINEIYSQMPGGRNE